MDFAALRFWRSTAFRLGLYYGSLLVLTLVVVLAVFYVQIVGVLSARLDRQAGQHLQRLVQLAQSQGQDALVEEIRSMLHDDVNSDTEIVVLTDAQGRRIIGNAEVAPWRRLSQIGLRDLPVVRAGRAVTGRVVVAHLDSGAHLIVGSDMQSQRDVEQLFKRASLMAAAFVLLLAVTGAMLFRRLVDDRTAAMRQTMSRVAGGDLRQRIPLDDREDEFTQLSRDINTMLERLEHLMDGVRHVSNTIAHNLRTPLTRILLRLRDAQQAGPEAQARALPLVAEEVSELGAVFDKLLQIAEVESGTLRRHFGPVDVARLLVDVTELYEPLAEEQQGELRLEAGYELLAQGDADLIASAVANLVDNAIKYACAKPGGQVSVQARAQRGGVEILVSDNGPGVDTALLQHLTTRFYRAHQDLPGYGLGLASVQAIVQLHQGTLQLSARHPGLQASLWLPAPPKA